MNEKYKELGLLVAKWSNIKAGDDADSEVDFIINNAANKSKVGFLSGAAHDICIAVVSMIAANRDEDYIMNRIEGCKNCYEWIMPSSDLSNENIVGCIIVPLFMSYTYSHLDEKGSQYSLFLGQSETKIYEMITKNPLSSLVRSIMTDALVRDHESISQDSIEILARSFASLDESESETQHAEILSSLSLPYIDTNQKKITESYLDVISAISFAFIKMNGGIISMDVFRNLVETVIDKVPSYASVANKVRVVAVGMDGDPNIVAHSLGIGMEL